MNNNGMYYKLFAMSVLSFISMYILMYMMVDRFENVYSNLNQIYMAGMMTMPMIIFEIILMKSMYPSKPANRLIIAISILFLIGFIAFTRWQTEINDKQFLRSMIPHHAGAILMCKEAPITDPEIKSLCQTIMTSQQSEIDWMKNKLNNLPQK